MSSDPAPLFAIRCTSRLTKGDDASARAWLSTLIPSTWSRLGPPKPRGVDPTRLAFAWGSCGPFRDMREAIFELEGGGDFASGVVRFDPESGTAHLTIVGRMRWSSSRSTLIRLVESATPISARVKEGGVESDDAEMESVVAWLVWRAASLPEGGPFYRQTPVAGGWLIETYKENSPDKVLRLEALRAWVPWRISVEGEMFDASNVVHESAIPTPAASGAEVTVPSYLRLDSGQAQAASAPRSAPITQPAASLTASTEPVDFRKLRDILLANPTPFMGATSPERLAELRAEAVGLDATTTPSPSSGDPDVEETMMLPSAGLRAQIRALPFAAPFPELDVERYAALCAELQVKGASEDLLARYGIAHAGALVALKNEQDRRFAADPALRARFEQRVAHFLSFMPRR